MNRRPPQSEIKGLLELIQLSDSAVPIGAAAHSFGLEGLVEAGGVSAATLMAFVESLLDEQGVMEAVFCRGAYGRSARGEGAGELCTAMSALKPARESREGSIVLGRRLLGLLESLLGGSRSVLLAAAFEDGEPHHALVFGYAGALLAVEEEMVVAACLHQLLTTVVSSAQRLMPVGQRQAASILWTAKERIAHCLDRSRSVTLETVGGFLPSLEIASMRHPSLPTRLFLS